MPCNMQWSKGVCCWLAVAAVLQSIVAELKKCCRPRALNKAGSWHSQEWSRGVLPEKEHPMVDHMVVIMMAAQHAVRACIQYRIGSFWPLHHIAKLYTHCRWRDTMVLLYILVMCLHNQQHMSINKGKAHIKVMKVTAHIYQSTGNCS